MEYQKMEISYEPLELVWFDNRGVCYMISARDRAPKPHKNMEPWAKLMFKTILTRILEELEESDGTT